MDRATTHAANGGFPLPAAGQPERVVGVRHEACGAETRVRLPRSVPSRAVRRVVCDRCAAPYEAPADAVSDVGPAGEADGDGAGKRPGVPRLAGISLPSLPSPPSLPSLPASRESLLRWAGIPVAALVVVLVLNAVQGGDEPAPPTRSAASAGADAGSAAGDEARAQVVVDATGRGGAPAKPDANAQIVSESTYTLALPAGWDRVSAQGGATFAAVAPGGEADATLWVEQDPKLDFAAFEARSLDQLEQLAGSAKVVERTTGPSPESTVVRIAADAPSGAPRYEALLRAGPGPDPYWYYLATTVQPDAPAEALEGVEVLQGSLVPEGAK